MEQMTGGYYKATIHRVVQPPVDQRDYSRLGVFYFVLPDDEVRLTRIQDSPVLNKYATRPADTATQAPTCEEYRKGRISTYGKIKLEKGPEEGVEVQYVAGVMVKHYD